MRAHNRLFLFNFLVLSFISYYALLAMAIENHGAEMVTKAKCHTRVLREWKSSNWLVCAARTTGITVKIVDGTGVLGGRRAVLYISVSIAVDNSNFNDTYRNKTYQ